MWSVAGGFCAQGQATGAYPGAQQRLSSHEFVAGAQSNEKNTFTLVLFQPFVAKPVEVPNRKK